jgi:hypothetical protein
LQHAIENAGARDRVSRDLARFAEAADSVEAAGRTTSGGPRRRHLAGPRSSTHARSRAGEAEVLTRGERDRLP